MILNNYDIIQTNVNNKKPYVDIKNKQIVCRLPIKHNYLIAKRYNTQTGYNDYYLIHTDEQIEGAKSIGVDLFGRYKFYIKSIWNNLGLDKLDRNTNIELTLVENDDTTNVYRIDC